MDFSFTAEQEELREYTREFLDSTFPIERVARLLDSDPGWDPTVVKTLGEMGWFDPDLTFLDLAVLYEESGAALLPATWFTTVTLVRPVLADGDELARRIDAGESRAVLAWAESPAASSLNPLRVTASATESGELSGTKVLVPDLEWADTALVLARGPGGEVGGYEIDLVPGIVTVQENLDAGRRFGTVVLDGVVGRRVALSPAGPTGLQARLLAALACEAVGVARRVLDIGVAYARDRVQFGRPIGSYQGVSHLLADSFKEIELARSLAYRAAWTIDQGAPAGADFDVCIAAKLQAARAALVASRNTIQVLGGIGMTWDHPVHRWLKRSVQTNAWESGGTAGHDALAGSILSRSRDNDTKEA